MSDDYEFNRRLNVLEGKAERRRMFADMGKKLLPAFAFITAGMVLALSSSDHGAAIAGIFFVLGGWLMMMVGL